MKIKCVAFDADNTLYSTREAAKFADSAAIDVLAREINQPRDILYNEWQKTVAKIKDSKDPKMRNRMYSYGKLADKFGAANTVNKMYAKMMEIVLKKIELLPGVKEILSKLKNKKIKLFVITEDEDREKALSKLKNLGILDYFDGVITSTDVGTMKPSEKYYTEILTVFSPSEILAVGDNAEKDLVIPAQLGIQTLLIENSVDLKKIEALVK
ncbi:MAG: HAD family hydrolase [Candidatus Colwellbacteria bacterium]|nr:HAD family hydrolase [Candidatus Colwellbacteria bacterium]